MALIMDNSSIHKAKRIREFANKYQEVKLFFLPPYSPEYNPTEQVWRWCKPLVHAAKTITDGVEELVGRIRRITRAWTHDKLACPPKIGVGIWKPIC